MKTYRVIGVGDGQFEVAWAGPTPETSGSIVVSGSDYDLLTAELNRLGFSLVI